MAKSGAVEDVLVVDNNLPTPIQVRVRDCGAIDRSEYESIDSAVNRAGLVELVARLKAMPAALRAKRRMHFSLRFTAGVNLSVDDFIEAVEARVEGSRGSKGFDGSATLYSPKSLEKQIRAAAEAQIAKSMGGE
jgi:hypothetical protein